MLVPSQEMNHLGSRWREASNVVTFLENRDGLGRGPWSGGIVGVPVFIDTTTDVALSVA